MMPRKKIFLALVGTAVAVLMIEPYARISPRLVVLDIGQGSAALIQAEHGQQCLVDGGPDNTVLEQLGSFMPPWDRTIECVIVSHADQDHMNGLFAVTRRYNVETIYWNGIDADLLKPILRESTHTQIVRAGDTIPLGSLTLEILSAFRGAKDRNDNSIVVLVDAAAVRALLMADVSVAVEEKLDLPRVDVVVVGHHGSKTSTSRKLLTQTQPTLAVISAGANNRYGHPHPSVLDRLQQQRIPIHRTDQDGSFVVELLSMPP